MPKKRGKEEQTLDEKLKMAIVPKEEEHYKVPDNWVWTRLGNITEKNQYGYTAKSSNQGEVKYLRITDIQDNKVVWNDVPYCEIKEDEFEDEQKRIVNKLDYFFDKIQKVKEIIEEVKEKNEARKESILSKAFTGELTAKWRASNIHSAKELLNKINDEKLSNWEQECQKAEAEGRKKPTKPKLKSIDEMIVPNDEIPYKIPNNWVWTRLGDIAPYIQRGKSPKYVDESSIYVISQKCVQWTGFELDKARYTSDEVKYTEERFLKKGDILWNSTGTGTVGRVCILENIDENQKMVADSHVTVVRTSNNVISKCILNYLISNNVQNNLDSLTTGSTNQKELTLSSVKNLAIPLPPIEEQKEIVRILDNIFTKENLINELISLEDKIQALEKSILSKAFRGELGTNSKKEIVRILDNIFTKENLINELISLEDKIQALEKSILSKAFRGELGTNSSDDIEAMELLKEILQK